MQTNVPTPHNFAPSPDFKWLCQELFLKIDQIKSSIDNSHTKRKKSKEVITRFVNLWRCTVGSDFYPVLVLALPQRDKRVFHIKDTTLIKAVCATLHLDLKSSTAQRLLDWKSHVDPGNLDQNRLSSICVKEISKRREEPESDRLNTVTLDSVNRWLDQLALQRAVAKNGGYSLQSLLESPLWEQIINRLSYLELKYFFDILLKVRILGAQENTLLYIWHPDARDYLSVVSDLHSVSQKLFDPNVRLSNQEITLQLNSPFYPQLAKRLVSKTYTDIVNRILIQKRGQDMFYIEEKMDGERIQIHYAQRGHSIKYYSRRGTDYTYLYGADLNNGSISPFLKINPKVENLILDGEMISFDKENNKILPFGMVKTVAKNSSDSNELVVETNSFHPLYMVFDLLYLNNVPLINFPLWQRKKYLKQIFQNIDNTQQFHARVKILPYMKCHTEEDIKKCLSLAIQANSEGIVLKNPQSKYVPASRNDSWIKIKPEYLDQFGENLDLIIMGRDSAIKDSYICGIALQRASAQTDITPIINLDSQKEVNSDSSEDDNGEEGTFMGKIVGFVSFCSIANGISKIESQEIQKLTRGKWHSFKDSPPPSHTTRDGSLFLQFGSKKPSEWIDPKDSVVLEIKARSIDSTESRISKYATGCTLYGGYCKAIRQDKDWTSCYTMDQFKRDRLFKSGHYMDNSSIKSHNLISKDVISKRRRKSPNFIIENKKLDMNSAEPISSIFQGLNFYIISDYFDPFSKNRIVKEQLMERVVENGGTVVYNLMTTNDKLSQLRIISDVFNIECRTLIERGYDILSPRWVLDCIQYKSLLQLEPAYCFDVSEELMKLAKKRIDSYGDSYQTPITEPLLKEIIESNSHLTEELSSQIELDSEVTSMPIFLFSGKKFYVPKWSQKYDSSAYNILLWKIRLYGGSLTDSINDCSIIIIIIIITTTTNVLSKKFPTMTFKDNIRKIRSQLAEMVNSNPKSITSIPHIVSAQWIDKSIEEGIQVPEELYPVLE